jgi:hypothetical protein
MQLGCLAILGGLYLLWAGGQGIYTAATNREPFQVACGSYGEVKPSSEWLELTGCSLSLMEASYTEVDGKVVELFIPARGENSQEGSTVHVLVATKDATLLSLANQLISIQDEQALMTFAMQNGQVMGTQRDVRGLVRYGVDLDDDEAAQLKNLDSTLAPDFIILDDGKEPALGLPLGMFGGGAVLVVIAGAIFVGGSGKS